MQASKVGPRELLLRPRAKHKALVAARKEQLTPEWKRKYERRSGVERTISQGVGAFGLRQARYIGQAKTQGDYPLKVGNTTIIGEVATVGERNGAIIPSSVSHRDDVCMLSATIPTVTG